MNRRILNIAELGLVTCALASAVWLLGEASLHPGSIAWAPVVLAGVITAAALAFIASAMFVGWLAVDAAQDAKYAWRRRQATRQREARERERTAHAGRHRPPTAPTPAERAAVGYKPVAGAR